MEYLKDNRYFGRTKMEDKKESVIGATRRNQAEIRKIQ